MSDPLTVNVGLAVPTRGSDVGTWDIPVNGDFTALDGFFGGVQTVSAAASPITLTVPAGFTATPGAGPTQAQNAVLRFTGALTGNVRVTLPMPGPMIVENLTTGNFVLSFQAVTATQVIAVDQGEIVRIYNDGANVRFIGLGAVGHIEMWGGLSAIPAWVAACTVPPYLLCDGSIYNFSTYPYLGKRLLGAFGGNGVTTFGVPDLRGRVPLAYDGTGARITAAGCGINGQTLGASADNQSVTPTPSQIPSITSVLSSATATSGGNYIPVDSNPIQEFDANISGGGAVRIPSSNPPNAGSWSGVQSLAVTGTVTYTNNSQASITNVQPSQVTGIPVIRAA